MGRLLDLHQRKSAGIRPDGFAYFECPECGWVTKLVPKVPVRASTPVRVSFHCECGVAHAVFLHVRASRVEVDALGTLVLQKSDIRLPALVRNVSRSGMLIELENRSDLQVGEELVIKFSLGPRSSVFYKTVEVRRVDDDLVGAKFIHNERREMDREFELALTQVQLGTPSI